MRIDRTHRPWLIGSCLLLGFLFLIYIPYALLSTKVGGGTPLGILYGVIGFGFMLFAAALGIRKRFPIWRIGRAQHWMRGHLWLGTMALPVIFLHGAFHFGGWLTTLLMVLLIIVTISGLFGAYLQHTLPTRMMHEVGYETIYDQIDHIREGLVTEAEQRFQSMTEEMAPSTGAGATVVLTYLDTVPELQTELAQYNAFYENGAKALSSKRGQEIAAQGPRLLQNGVRTHSRSAARERPQDPKGPRRDLRREAPARPPDHPSPHSARLAALSISRSRSR